MSVSKSETRSLPATSIRFPVTGAMMRYLMKRYRDVVCNLFFIICHPSIPFHFEEKIFVLPIFGCTEAPSIWASPQKYYRLRTHHDVALSKRGNLRIMSEGITERDGKLCNNTRGCYSYRLLLRLGSYE